MIFAFDSYELDTELYELRKAGRPTKVEPQVFDMLCLLADNAGRVVTRNEMIERIWDGRIVSETTVSTCVKAARQAIGDDGKAQRLIKTVHGRGFRLVGAIRPLDGPAASETASAVLESASTPDLPEKPVIAVLPFDNLSVEGDAYFADGITEDIITNLAKFRDLLVIARTSTFKLKGEALDPKEVGAALNAGFVVEGSVRRAGGRVRITAQLIDAATGLHLWAHNYDRDMEDIFAVQDEVTRTIAATLGVKLQDVAQRRALRKNASELDAYDCVLRARRFTTLLSADAHAEARDLLERAVELDPTSADAHALLANVYLAEHRFDVNPRSDPIGRALAMAQKAVALDPENAYARCWLAVVYFFRHENGKFEAEAARALALNPNDPETLADIGHFLSFMGQFERGLELSMKARLLNPLHPGWYHFTTARYHYGLKQYDETVHDVENIAMPHFYWALLVRAAALGQMGDPEAGEVLDRVFELKPDFDAVAELRKWNTPPGEIDHMMEGLEKAGAARAERTQ